MTEKYDIKAIIDAETGLVKLEGFLYDPNELEEGCKNIGLHDRIKDFDSLCEER